MENIKLLYNSKEIFKFFKETMKNIDKYDFHTMEYFIKNKLDKLTLNDLEIMLKTIKDEGNYSDSFTSFFGNSFNSIITIIAMFSASFVSLLAILCSYLLENGQIQAINIIENAFNIQTIMAVLYLLLVSILFISQFISNKRRIRTLRLIKIIIYIKKQG